MNNWHYKDKMIMNYHDLQIESNLMEQQFKRNVLYDNKSWNNNIGGRYNFIPAVCNQLRYERFMEQY